MKRVVILMQENKTPDFYFPTLASWGRRNCPRGFRTAGQESAFFFLRALAVLRSPYFNCKA
jgi:phospholipase C